MLGTFGFVSSKDILSYLENKDKLITQQVAVKYEQSFDQAIRLAELEHNLNKHERMAFVEKKPESKARSSASTKNTGKAKVLGVSDDVDDENSIEVDEIEYDDMDQVETEESEVFILLLHIYTAFRSYVIF